MDSISGAKRKQNLTEHAENARISKQLATAVRDVDVDVDFAKVIAREPDRSRLRETFREFELRAPLERLEEALGEGDVAAPAERVDEVIEVRAREVPLAEIGALGGELVAIAALRPGEDPDEAVVPPPADPEAELGLEEDAALEAVEEEIPAVADTLGQGSFDFEGGPRGPLTVAGWAGEEVLVAEAETLAAFAMARGERPIVAHDWKTIAMADDACAAPPLAHDTLVAAYLIDPARRGYPLDELATELGLGARVKTNGAHPAEPGGSARQGADGVAERAVLTRLLAERQRDRLAEDGLTSLFHQIELPLVDVLVEMERAGIKLDIERLRA